MPQTRSTNLLLAFDAFGTLFAPKFPIAAQYAFIAREHGLTGVKENDVHTAFKKAFREESKRNPNYGKTKGMKPDEWWTNIITNTFTTITSSPLPPSLAPALIHNFASSDGYKLYPDVTPLLHTLRSPPLNWPYSRTILGVITNSDSRVTSILNSLGVGVRSYHPTEPNQTEKKEEGVGDSALLDFVTFSYDVGCEKPDIGIFDAARTIGLQSAGSSGEDTWRCVHVGDDPVKDYLGAELAGWKGVLIDRMAERDENPSKVVIKRLDEVLEILVNLEKYKSS